MAVVVVVYGKDNKKKGRLHTSVEGEPIEVDAEDRKRVSTEVVRNVPEVKVEAPKVNDERFDALSAKVESLAALVTKMCEVFQTPAPVETQEVAQEETVEETPQAEEGQEEVKEEVKPVFGRKKGKRT